MKRINDIVYRISGSTHYCSTSAGYDDQKLHLSVFHRSKILIFTVCFYSCPYGERTHDCHKNMFGYLEELREKGSNVEKLLQIISRGRRFNLLEKKKNLSAINFSGGALSELKPYPEYTALGNPKVSLRT